MCVFVNIVIGKVKAFALKKNKLFLDSCLMVDPKVPAACGCYLKRVYKISKGDYLYDLKLPAASHPLSWWHIDIKGVSCLWFLFLLLLCNWFYSKSSWSLVTLLKFSFSSGDYFSFFLYSPTCSWVEEW